MIEEIFVEYSKNIYTHIRWIFATYSMDFGWINHAWSFHSSNIHREFFWIFIDIFGEFVVNISWILVKCDLSNKIDSQIFTQYVRWIFDEWTFHSSNIHRTYWVNICGMRRVTKKRAYWRKIHDEYCMNAIIFHTYSWWILRRQDRNRFLWHIAFHKHSANICHMYICITCLQFPLPPTICIRSLSVTYFKFQNFGNEANWLFTTTLRTCRRWFGPESALLVLCWRHTTRHAGTNRVCHLVFL